MIEDLKPQANTLFPTFGGKHLPANPNDPGLPCHDGRRPLGTLRRPTKAFNQAIQRNMDRFPEDFMFRLTEEEFAGLRSQFVTSKKGRGGRRYLPYVFTEQGVRCSPVY